MKTSDQLAKLSKALVTALGAVTGVTKDSKNPHFKNDYASLEAVTEMARPILAANGLCVVQSPGALDGGRIPVTTRIIHESGEWIEGEIVIPLSKADAQGAGSAVTYARRYALMAMLGVAPVDDDGEGAVQRTPANNGAPANGLGTEKRDTGPGSIDGKDWFSREPLPPGPSPAAAKRDPEMQARFDLIQGAIRNVLSEAEWRAACREFHDDIVAMPRPWRSLLREEADSIAKELNIDLNRKAA